MPGKRICVLTSMPESTHGQRILDGILTQCRKYRYQVAVFATMTNLMHSDRAYQRGEEIIYQLPDFDFFDGVIMDTVTFGGGGTGEGTCTCREDAETADVVCLGENRRCRCAGWRGGLRHIRLVAEQGRAGARARGGAPESRSGACA